MNQIQITKAKNGADTLLINGKYIHSAYRPDADGQHVRLASDVVHVIFGVGLGYYVLNVTAGNPQACIIVYEPIEQLRDKFISKHGSFIADRSDRVLFLSVIDYDLIYKFIESHTSYGAKRLNFIRTSYCEMMPDESSYFYEYVKKTYAIYVQNMMTTANFAQLWTRNHIRNVSLLSHRPLCAIDTLQCADLYNQLAIIIGAGPTLDDEWETLSQYRDSITTFCVDTALKPMLYHNVIPDFIITLDGQLYSLDDFPANVPNQCHIISELTSYPQINRDYHNVHFVINDDKSYDDFAHLFLQSAAAAQCKSDNLSDDICHIGISGTVADFALKFAAELGFGHIALLGIDLSYPGLTTHARHTPGYDSFFCRSDYFHTMSTQNAAVISARRISDAVSKTGQNVLSDFVLSNYADGFASFADIHTSIHIYNIMADGASENVICRTGLDIPHIGNVTLKQLLSMLQSKNQLDHIVNDILTDKYLDIETTKTTLARILDKAYNYSQQIKALYESTQWDRADNLLNWTQLIDALYHDLPFMRRFAIMQNVIRGRQSQDDADMADMVFYRNVGFVLLQSLYFVIRTLQSVNPNCDTSAAMG